MNIGKNDSGLKSFVDKEDLANGPSAHFPLPQVLQDLFKFMLNCEEFATREQILRDLKKFHESNSQTMNSPGGLVLVRETLDS
jgi:hypothetical protein